MSADTYFLGVVMLAVSIFFEIIIVRIDDKIDEILKTLKEINDNKPN